MGVKVEEIIKKLKMSYILDLSKPKIDKFERARLLREYMKDNVISMRAFCKKFNFKLGTVSGWLKWGQLGKTRYDNFKKKGLSESDITQIIKKENSTIESQLLTQINILNGFIARNKFKLNKDTIECVKLLQNKLNYLLYRNGD